MASPFEISLKNSWRFILPCLILLSLSAGCSPTNHNRTKVHVFAASSMQEVMLEAKKGFETQYTNSQVVLNFAGSQVLKIQIEQGAPADLYISANQEHIQTLQESGLVHKKLLLAHNELVIATPTDNPSKIKELKDLANASRIVIGTAQSPIGIYTRKMLQKADKEWQTSFENEIMARVVSQENNVRLIRAKVALGEADAALVYRTDTIKASKVRAVSIPPHLNIKAAYIMGLTQRASKDALAKAFFDFFATPKGLALLTRHGFVVN